MLLSYFLLTLSALVAASPVPEELPPFSPHTSHLRRVANTDLKRIRRRAATSGTLISTNGGNSFLADIKFGTQTVEVVVDTGSSDTWLIGYNFTCLTSQGDTQPESECNFGPVYDYNSDGTLVQTAAEEGDNFLLSYGDGEYVAGAVANDKVTFAGVSFTTEIGIGLAGYWNGDGISSGLIGLAFPILTSAYTGTDPSQDTDGKRRTYPSFLQQLFIDNHYTPAMFTLAMSRDVSKKGYGGSITMGGVPNLSDPRVNAKANYVYAPFQHTADISTTEFSFYTINVQNIAWGSGSSAGHALSAQQYIVDSGTSYIYVPTRAATAFNALWPGQTTFDKSSGVTQVECGSVPPPFSVTIAGATFPINPKDLIHTYSDGTCESTIVDVQTGPTLILGDVFLKNVVAVFDWGKSRMWFTGRELYTS